MKAPWFSVVLGFLCAPWAGFAAGDHYGGVIAGLSTLSADGASAISATAAAASLYKPENGPAFYLLGGRHLSDYLSIQANYGWNRNHLTLTSVNASQAGQAFYEQERNSSQHIVLGDLLLYFRNRRSFARPYLSVGTGFIRFRSTERNLRATAGSPSIPPAEFASSALALRVAVGIELKITQRWAVRYSFSEALRQNPISAQLSPSGRRHLANFQNLFGLVKTF